MTEYSLPTNASSTPQRPTDFRFSLSTLMLLVTLASVLMGVLTVIPPLGVLLAGLSVVALSRTSTEVRRRLSKGRQVGADTKVLLFLAQIIGVYMVLMFAGVAFILSLFLSGLCAAVVADLFDWGWSSSLAGLAGFVLGCVLSYYVIKQSWKATKPSTQ